jgi:hypothetical protein
MTRAKKQTHFHYARTSHNSFNGRKKKIQSVPQVEGHRRTRGTK